MPTFDPTQGSIKLEGHNTFKQFEWKGVKDKLDFVDEFVYTTAKGNKFAGLKTAAGNDYNWKGITKITGNAPVIKWKEYDVQFTTKFTPASDSLAGSTTLNLGTDAASQLRTGDILNVPDKAGMQVRVEAIDTATGDLTIERLPGYAYGTSALGAGRTLSPAGYTSLTDQDIETSDDVLLIGVSEVPFSVAGEVRKRNAVLAKETPVQTFREDVEVDMDRMQQEEGDNAQDTFKAQRIITQYRILRQKERTILHGNSNVDSLGRVNASGYSVTLGGSVAHQGHQEAAGILSEVRKYANANFRTMASVYSAGSGAESVKALKRLAEDIHAVAGSKLTTKYAHMRSSAGLIHLDDLIQDDSTIDKNVEFVKLEAVGSGVKKVHTPLGTLTFVHDPKMDETAGLRASILSIKQENLAMYQKKGYDNKLLKNTQDPSADGYAEAYIDKCAIIIAYPEEVFVTNTITGIS